jgi:uncharacterized membrane protein SirB2
MIRLGRAYDNYVSFIIFIKILFIFFAVVTFLLKTKIKYSNNKNDDKKIITIYNNLSVCKETLEFLFIISIALICIIVFYPFYKEQVIIDRHTRLLLFLYGFIILITANWSVLTKLPTWFVDLQTIVGYNKKVI